MNWALAGQIATGSVAAIAVLAVILKRAREFGKRCPTVENEQIQSRSIVGNIPQWEWRALQDAENDEINCDDPCFALLHEIAIRNQAQQL